MSKVSEEERELLDLARNGWGPSSGVKRALRARIPERLRADPTYGLDAPGPSATTTSARYHGSAAALVRSPWGVVVGLAAVGLFVFFGTRGVPRELPNPVSAIADTPAGSPEGATETASPPEIRTVSLDALPDVPTAAPAKGSPPRPRAARPASSPIATTASGADTLGEEVALVRAAQRSLRDGAPAEALVPLSKHASRFPDGVLREERMALQVRALCAVGEMAKARSIRAELLRFAADSSHLEGLSCAAP